MDIVNVILTQLRETSVIMGLIALVDLLLQKKSAVDVFSGTVKTIIGFMIFNIGSMQLKFSGLAVAAVVGVAVNAILPGKDYTFSHAYSSGKPKPKKG